MSNVRYEVEQYIDDIYLETEKQLEKRSVALSSKYTYKNDSFMIVIPTSEQDFIDEGKALNYCVACYISRFLSGKTAILFIRKVEEADKPFYTIEISEHKNSIIRIAGKNNCNATKEVQTFVNEWLTQIEIKSK